MTTICNHKLYNNHITSYHTISRHIVRLPNEHRPLALVPFAFSTSRRFELGFQVERPRLRPSLRHDHRMIILLYCHNAICMYIYIYIYMLTHEYIHVHLYYTTHVGVCVYIHISIDVYTHAAPCVRGWASWSTGRGCLRSITGLHGVHTYIYIYIHTHTTYYIYIYIYIYIYHIYIYIYIYTHTCRGGD